MAKQDENDRVAAARAKARKQLKDLNDEKTQAEIMNPEGREVQIGGKPLMLYPLSGHSVRRLMGLSQQVFASAQGHGSLAFRISGVLLEGYLDRFMPLLAESTFSSPAEVEPEKMLDIIKEIDRKTASAYGGLELADAFAAVCEINGIDQALNADGPNRPKTTTGQPTSNS